MYTDFMVVGTDTGILCCELCGALVPHDRRRIVQRRELREAARLVAVEAMRRGSASHASAGGQ